MWRAAFGLGLAACGFSAGAAFDANPNSHSVIDDSAATFAAGAGSDGVVTSRGTLEPDAFVLGGLHARGFVGALVGATTTWDALTPTLGPPAGERYGELPVTDWGLGWPVDLGLAGTNGDNFTVVYDGEIYLTGATTLQVAVDDDGFVDVAPDGVTYQSVHVQVSDNPLKTLSATPVAPGWYPIRAAMSEHSVTARMIISVIGAGGVAAPIDPSLLRARVTAAPGLIVTGFQSGLVLGALGSAVDPGAIDHQWTAVPSYDLESPAGSASAAVPLTFNSFSLRYAGEVLVDTADTETYAVALGAGSAEAFRIALDGNVIASRQWPGLADQAAAPTLLTAGWHDLIVDYNHFGPTAGLDLQRNGVTIASDHLRPAIARGQIASTMVAAGGMVSDAAPEVTSVTLVAPMGATVDWIDWGFQLMGGRMNLSATLAAGGTRDSYVIPPMPDAAALAYDDVAGHTTFAGDPVHASAPWTVTVAKTMPGGPNPMVGNSAVAATYHGGAEMPFAPVWSYTATPRMVPGLTAITGATVTADLRGATLKLEVRTAADANAIASATWIDVTTAPPPPAAASVLEYRVTVTGDGWELPSISKVEIDYLAGR